MIELALVVKGLAGFLSERWGETVRVENTQMASAGARRLNLLFDATRGSETLFLVATIVPNPAMQVMDVEVEASTQVLSESSGASEAHLREVCSEA